MTNVPMTPPGRLPDLELVRARRAEAAELTRRYAAAELGSTDEARRLLDELGQLAGAIEAELLAVGAPLHLTDNLGPLVNALAGAYELAEMWDAHAHQPKPRDAGAG